MLLARKWYCLDQLTWLALTYSHYLLLRIWVGIIFLFIALQCISAPGRYVRFHKCWHALCHINFLTPHTSISEAKQRQTLLAAITQAFPNLITLFSFAKQRLTSYFHACLTSSHETRMNFPWKIQNNWSPIQIQNFTMFHVIEENPVVHIYAQTLSFRIIYIGCLALPRTVRDTGACLS